jgi:AhpD family alkylhydroperoxidase
MKKLSEFVRTCGLAPSLLELVMIRASQLNRCAYCVAWHLSRARAAGEAQRRLDSLIAWRDTPLFSQRERAALEMTEVVTQISSAQMTDEVYDFARSQFSEEELVKLVLAIATINAWNRLMATFRPAPE